jgi:hypothetical protein
VIEYWSTGHGGWDCFVGFRPPRNDEAGASVWTCLMPWYPDILLRCFENSPQAARAQGWRVTVWLRPSSRLIGAASTQIVP